jgi:cytidyltransferase-like protein
MAGQRKKLERLCRHITRPTVAEQRLSLAGNGNVIVGLKTPYSDGTFDLLQVGHLALLEQCRTLGDVVVVGVASDCVVNSYKPHNIDVEDYLKSEGKKVNQVLYNLRTSSTAIKKDVMSQQRLLMPEAHQANISAITR